MAWDRHKHVAGLNRNASITNKCCKNPQENWQLLSSPPPYNNQNVKI
jgi:hypothetical protein